MIVGGGHAATLAGRLDLPVVNSSKRPLEDYAVSSASAGSAIAPLAAEAEDVYVPALLARKNPLQSVSSRRDDAGRNRRHADGIGAIKLVAAPRYHVCKSLNVPAFTATEAAAQRPPLHANSLAFVTNHRATAE